MDNNVERVKAYLNSLGERWATCLDIAEACNLIEHQVRCVLNNYPKCFERRPSPKRKSHYRRALTEYRLR